MESGRTDRLQSLRHPIPEWSCLVHACGVQEGHTLHVCWEAAQIPHLHTGKLRSCKVRVLLTYLAHGWSSGM